MIWELIEGQISRQDKQFVVLPAEQDGTYPTNFRWRYRIRIPPLLKNKRGGGGASAVISRDWNSDIFLAKTIGTHGNDSSHLCANLRLN